MAARKQLAHHERVKQKIKVSQLINRLQNHALCTKYLVIGEGDNAVVKLATDMTTTQIKAAETLLRKCLPDLKAIEATVDVDLDVSFKWEE